MFMFVKQAQEKEQKVENSEKMITEPKLPKLCEFLGIWSYLHEAYKLCTKFEFN